MRSEEIVYIDDVGIIHYVDVSNYPSGEPMVKEFPDSTVCRVLLRPRSAVGFLGGIMWVKAYLERGNLAPEIICPNVFGARQDRVNSSGDYLFTIKFVAELINSLIAPKVFVVDPHSDVTPALIKNCVVVHPYEFLTHGSLSAKPAFMVPNCGPYEAVISPDAGAEKRASMVAKRLQIPLIHAWKSRNVATGEISGFGIEPAIDEYRGRKVLIVDDMCDGGGTFVGLNAKLAAGVTADLYTTHGLYTKGTDKLLSIFGKVICTDSVVTQRPGVEIIKVCEKLLVKGSL